MFSLKSVLLLVAYNYYTNNISTNQRQVYASSCSTTPGAYGYNPILSLTLPALTAYARCTSLVQ